MFKVPAMKPSTSVIAEDGSESGVDSDVDLPLELVEIPPSGSKQKYKRSSKAACLDETKGNASQQRKKTKNSLPTLDPNAEICYDLPSEESKMTFIHKFGKNNSKL